MLTGNTATPEERNEPQRKRGYANNSPESRHPSAKRKVSTDDSHSATSQHSSMHTYGANVARENGAPLLHSSASLAFANSEALRIGQLEMDYVASMRRSIELSRLASLTQSQMPAFQCAFPPVVHSMPSWPMIVVPTPHRPILGCAAVVNSFVCSPVDGLDPMFALMSSHPSSSVASRPTFFSRNASSASSKHFIATRTSKRTPPYSSSDPEFVSTNHTRQNRNSDVDSTSARQAVRFATRASSTATHDARSEKQMTQTDPGAAVMTLYLSEDRDKLSNHQSFLRKQIEIFRATDEDILSITRGKNKPIVLQQVGLRCRHCSHIPAGGRTKGATYFPSTLMGVYQAAQNMCVEHFQSGRCTELPFYVRERFSTYTSGKNMASVVGKKYWAEGARKLGLVDTDDGIRFATDLN